MKCCVGIDHKHIYKFLWNIEVTSNKFSIFIHCTSRSYT